MLMGGYSVTAPILHDVQRFGRQSFAVPTFVTFCVFMPMDFYRGQWIP